MAMTSRFDPKRHHRRSIRLPGYDYRQAGAYFVTICTHEGELLFDDPVLRRVAETFWQRIPRHFPHAQLDAWVIMPNHIHGIIVITDAACRGEASSENPSPTNGVATTGTGSAPAEITQDSNIAIAGERRRGEASPENPSPANQVAAVGVGSAQEGIPSRGKASPENPSSTDGIATAGAGSVAEKVVRDALPLHIQGPSPGSLGAIVGNFKSVTARRINRLRHTPGMPVWQRNYYEHIVRTEDALYAIRQYIADNPLRWTLDTYNPAATERDPRAVELWNVLQAEGVGAQHVARLPPRGGR